MREYEMDLVEMRRGKRLSNSVDPSLNGCLAVAGR